MSGSLSSLAVMAWIVGHTQYFLMDGQLQYPGKHTSVHMCAVNYSTDTTSVSSPSDKYNQSSQAVRPAQAGLQRQDIERRIIMISLFTDRIL